MSSDVPPSVSGLKKSNYPSESFSFSSTFNFFFFFPAKGFRRRLLQQSVWSPQTAGEGVLWTGVQTPQRKLRENVKHKQTQKTQNILYFFVLKLVLCAAGVVGAAEAARQAD